MDKIPHTKFSTDLLPEKDRFEAWRDSMGVIFDIEREERDNSPPFEAHLEGFIYGQLVVGMTASNAAHYMRPTSKVNRDGLDMIMVQLFLEGEMQFGVDREITRVANGDMIVFDLGQKADNFDADYKVLAVIFPRETISEFIPDIGRWHGKILPRNQPMTILLRQHLFSLYHLGSEMTVEFGASIQRSTLELTASAFRASEANLARSAAIVTATILQEIRVHIRTHLARPGLSPESIAGAFGLSRAQLYRTTESLNGIMNYIRDLRLRRCWKELQDPAFFHVSISEMGFKWGFNDIRTFNRNFKNCYGMTPSDTRKIGNRKRREKQPKIGALQLETDRSYEGWLRSQA